MFATVGGYNGAGRGGHGGGANNKPSANAATDCFWFMKQPGGCAKGAACTYRHSEGARLSCKVGPLVIPASIQPVSPSVLSES